MAPAAEPARLDFELVEFADRIPDHLTGNVLLLGNFDGFHRGHATLLDAARRAARGAPIGIMSSEPHPRQLFAPDTAPFRITTARTKLDGFERLGFSFAFMPRFTHAFAGQSARHFVEHTLVRDLKVAHVVAGEDFRFGHRRAGDVALLRQIGSERGFGVTEVAMLHRQDAVCSSSLIRQMLEVGDMDAATMILGRPWSVEVGAVDHCHAGLRLDWPAEVILPAPGDYPVQIRERAACASRGKATLRIDTDGIYLRGMGAVLGSDRLLIEFTGS